MTQQDSKLRVAVIGAGNICRSCHIPCLTGLGMDIACVVDPSNKALSSIRGNLPSTVKYVGSGQLDLPSGIDCAVVCSPTSLHAAQVESLLENNLHVLCEKPIALTEAEAKRIVGLAAERKRVLQVGYYRRFHPASRLVKELVRSAELGRPRSCTVRAGHIFNDAPASLMDKSLSGGGVLIDFGVHVIDRLYSWFDDVVLLQYSDDSRGGVEANAVVRLEGRVGTVTLPIVVALSRTNDLGYFSVVHFENASVAVQLNSGHEVELISASPVGLLGQSHRLTAKVQVGPAKGAIEYFCDQWQEFTARIAGSPERISSLADAVRTTAMVETCYANRWALELEWGW